MSLSSTDKMALTLVGAIALASSLPSVQAHEHHAHGPADNSVPIDSILWIHIGVQTFSWFFLFPLAMVLGMVRHRLHVPVATTSLALTVGGYFLGHGHGGRSFPKTAHGTMASLLVFYLAAQTFLGIYLKLHLPEKRLRPTLVTIHGILGKSFPSSAGFRWFLASPRSSLGALAVTSANVLRTTSWDPHFKPTQRSSSS